MTIIVYMYSTFTANPFFLILSTESTVMVMPCLFYAENIFYLTLKGPSQPPPFSMPSKLLIMHGQHSKLQPFWSPWRVEKTFGD